MRAILPHLAGDEKATEGLAQSAGGEKGLIEAFEFEVSLDSFMFLPDITTNSETGYFCFPFSDENTAVNHTGILPFGNAGDGHDWRRPRSESSADAESVYMTNVVIDTGYHGLHSRRSSVSFVIQINIA